MLAAAVAVRGAPAADAGPDKPVAVLCLGQDASIANGALPRKLAAEHNLQVSGCGFGELTWDVLRQFNVVLVFDMSRFDPETKRVVPIDIRPEGLRRVSDLLYRFVEAGGFRATPIPGGDVVARPLPRPRASCSADRLA